MPTPDEALTILRRWRQRDEEANLAVRSVLQKYEYDNLAAVHAEDPELLVFIHDALEPLLGMDDRFALEDALVREGRRDVTGRTVELAPPEGPARDLPAPPSYRCPQCGPTSHTAGCHTGTHHVIPPDPCMCGVL